MYKLMYAKTPCKLGVLMYKEILMLTMIGMGQSWDHV